MDPLFIKETDTTFKVVLDKANGIFEFTGRSRPENVVSFFEPIFDWFKEYETNPNTETIVSFNLDYFNSSSAKVLLRFLVLLESMNQKGISVKIQWLYKENDEDILETGEDYASLVDVPFEFTVFE